MLFPDCKRVLIARAVSKPDKKSHFPAATPHAQPQLQQFVALTAQSCVQIFSNSSTKLYSTHTITINLGSALAE